MTNLIMMNKEHEIELINSCINDLVYEKTQLKTIDVFLNFHHKTHGKHSLSVCACRVFFFFLMPEHFDHLDLRLFRRGHQLGIGEILGLVSD